LLSELRDFESNKSNVELLLEIQSRIHKALCNLERRAAVASKKAHSLKHSLRCSRPPKHESVVLKRRINELLSRIVSYKEISYIYRALGDGLAFSLFDKYDLKPLAFKEPPGALTGKGGSRLERKILRAFIKKGIPAIHCDITNVLRYGDICIKFHGFPFFVEVKSSGNRNRRVDRQIQNMQKLHKYYATDVIDGLYGVPKIHRMAPSSPERNHVNTLNELIQESRISGCATKEVEEGLVYLVASNLDPSALTRILESMTTPIAAVLNLDKFSGHWSSYFPYTLTIRNVNDVLAFIEDTYVIAVVYDNQRVIEIAQSHNYKASFFNEISTHFPESATEGQWLYHFEETGKSPEQTSRFCISEHYFSRVFFELLSLEWIIRESFSHFKKAVSVAKSSSHQFVVENLREPIARAHRPSG
jgi:hypothetical protein